LEWGFLALVNRSGITMSVDSIRIRQDVLGKAGDSWEYLLDTRVWLSIRLGHYDRF
jgi:hypothetical protein